MWSVILLWTEWLLTTVWYKLNTSQYNEINHIRLSCTVPTDSRKWFHTIFWYNLYHINQIIIFWRIDFIAENIVDSHTNVSIPLDFNSFIDQASPGRRRPRRPRFPASVFSSWDYWFLSWIIAHSVRGLWERARKPAMTIEREEETQRSRKARTSRSWRAML